MAMHFIPRRTRIKTEIYRDFTFVDLIIAVVGIIATIAIMLAGFRFSIYVGLSFASFWIMLFVPVSEGVRIYYSIVLTFKFMAYKKSYNKTFEKPSDDIARIIPFTGMDQAKFIAFGEYYASVIEIFPTEFFLLDDAKQGMMINNLGMAFSRLHKNQRASIVKVKKPMVLDQMVNYEDEKYNTLLELGERGVYNEYELDARSPMFEERLRLINRFNREDKILKNHYYLVIYDSDREMLESTVNGIVANLLQSQTPILSNILTGDRLLIFMRSTFNEHFDEREVQYLGNEQKIKWAIPDNIKFSMATTTIDTYKYRTFTITDYPIEVPNAWMYPIFELDQARVVVNFHPVEKYKAERLLDKSLVEMEIKLNKAMKTSHRIESQTHYQTLRSLLVNLKNNNENLFNATVHITAEEGQKKEVRAILRQNGFKFTENFGRQIDAFVSSNISRVEALKMYDRGIHTTSFAAMFPFISSALQDPRGFYLGYNQYPVFTNFFMRNSERVNSNMIIIGKSGSGKSFAAKTLLANFASDNTRIFILDPENEYEILCKSLGGKIIDVGSSVNGIFNPFHIYANLQDDEAIGAQSLDNDYDFILPTDTNEQDDSVFEDTWVNDDAFNSHLQFLEQFFKVILPGMDPGAFETLNSTVVELYKNFKIDETTRVHNLSITAFPIFDDLLSLVNYKLITETEPYLIGNLQVVKTFIEKFAKGGRNANLWNGYTSIETDENFVCFNFMSLISNRNDLVASAQMLLVFKYLNAEIIKNREFNRKYFATKELEEEKRRIVIAVDEAHVFINPKYPIALDFMAQMAKRIRKYHGMQIILTQNIKDFVGTPEIAQQSTAVINASQYSMIFSLAANDMTDLIALYRNAGGINAEEQDSILTAPRGRAFLITGSTSRTGVQIEASAFSRRLFETGI